MLEYKAKVIVIGPGGVGKTSLIQRFVKGQFSIDYKLTIGVDFLMKSIDIDDNTNVKLTIWDIGGQERFKFLQPNLFANAQGAMIVFDLSRPETFEECKFWYKDMIKSTGKIPFILVGNKSDLVKHMGECISDEEANSLAEDNGGFYIKTSAKTGKNILTAFTELALRIIKK